MILANSLLNTAIWIPLLPLLAAAMVGLLGSRLLRGASHYVVILGVGGAAVCSYLVLSAVGSMQAAEFEQTYRLYSWIRTASGISLDISFRIDPLTAIMLSMVTTISLLVVVYSRDYMREHNHPERGYERFFAFLGLFVFSMCTLVLAGNFLLLYLGWEAVGLCSYLLIGFYYHRPAAAAAAKKAFLVNRIGDFGFGLGIFFIYLWVAPHVAAGENPLDYAVVFRHIHDLGPDRCAVIALLLFCGAVGKSAQLPLYVWLPDAMEGPSPVSALIHAATMVTAGVYMVVRCGPIFVQSPTAMAVVASVGAVTALYAATIAVAQYDMKRILAYSTISQLGYMFLGVGVFAADSAVFHLYTHAFFKALLFLGAGSVMHAMGGIIDVRRFGGLRRVLPWTCLTFVIGSLALAGFPLLSGFFSKDEIIHAAWSQNRVLGGIGLLTALLTAFYTFRMVFLAFGGPQHIPAGVHAHESGKWMLVPLLLLAVGAAGAGYLGVPAGHGPIHSFLSPVVVTFREAPTNPLAVIAAHGGESAHEGGHLMMIVSAILAIVGILAAYVLFVRRRDWAESVRNSSPQVYDMLVNKYYIDEMNEVFIVQPLRRLAFLFYAIDRFVVDGLVWAVTAVPRTIGFVLRGMQNGAMQNYGLSMTAGLAILVAFTWWIGG